MYLVVGTGAGAHATAALLKREGLSVCLWARDNHALTQLKHLDNRILVSGAANCSVQLDFVTASLHNAVKRSKVIILPVPASAHSELAVRLSEVLTSEHIVVLTPGRTGGALDFLNTLRRCRISESRIPLIVETQSLFCACRKVEIGHVDILSFKKTNVISGLPFKRLSESKLFLAPIFDGLRLVQSTLVTGLDNIGAVLHPAPVILNTGWIESRDIFFAHYYQAISPTVATFIEKMDQERLGIAAALGITATSVKDWHEHNYGGSGGSLYEVLKSNSSYASIDAPRSMRHRYLTDDLLTGLVPLSELGRCAGIKTPYMDATINLATLLMNYDFRMSGRNASRLGFEGRGLTETLSLFGRG